MATPTNLTAPSADVTATLARLDARMMEINRLLQGTFLPGAIGASSKLDLILEGANIVGAKIDLVLRYADNRETTPAAIAATIAQIKNQRAIGLVMIAFPFTSSAERARLRDVDAKLAVQLKDAELLYTYTLERTPTPAERAALPSSLTNPQGVDLAQWDKLQQTETLKKLAVIGGLGVLGYFFYRSVVWKS